MLRLSHLVQHFLVMSFFFVDFIIYSSQTSVVHVNHIFITHSLGDSHLGRFLSLALLNGVGNEHGFWMFKCLCNVRYSFWVCMPRNCMIGSYHSSNLALWETPILIPQCFCWFAISVAMNKISHLPETALALHKQFLTFWQLNSEGETAILTLSFLIDRY